MGVLPTPNHLALIRDCYPPHTNSSESELPRPVSNAVSKLAFYAVNRPAKLPKVVAALTDRAARATGGAPVPTSSSSTAHAHPVKNRIQLAVTCEIFRTLVIECAESGNQGSAELVKSALAEPALSVADMALGGGSAGPPKSARDANTRTASPTLRRPDAELEARGASLFHAVATMTTPPFFGFGLAARQYQRCLATLSARVQLTGATDHTGSRYVALKALEGAARSDIMFATGSDFDRQVGQVAPALFCTCLASSPFELEERLLESDSLSPLPSSLRSRKATAISPPSSSSDSTASSKAPPPVSTVAVHSLAHLSRHSTVPQLLVIHSNFLAYLEEHSSAPLTRSPDDVITETTSGGPAPAIAKTLLAAAPEPHRSPALSWWADRAAESTDPGRTIALLEILRHLIVGLAAPAPAPPQKGKSDNKTEHRPVSLNASGILNTLAEMLVLRSSLATAGISASDPVVDAIYSTLAALVEASDRVGYPSQLDDLAAETISLLAALNQTEEHEFPVEEVRIERLTAGMDRAAKARARERLLVVLKMLAEPARAAGAAPSTATRIDQHLEEQIPTTLPSTLELRPAVADNSVKVFRDSLPSSSGRPELSKQDTVTSPATAATTSLAAAATVTAIPGLALGAPIERQPAGVVDTAAARATRDQQAEEEAVKAPAQPIFLVHPPSSGHLDSIDSSGGRGGGGGGEDAPETDGITPSSSDQAAHAHAHSLSPYTISRSLFLLSDSYPPIRSAYLDFLITFLRQLASLTTEEEEANKAAAASAETDAFWRKLAVEFCAAASAPTSPAEEKEMMRLAEAAFSIRSGSAVLACLPMLLSQLQAQPASGPTIAKHALATLARTWHVDIPANTADVDRVVVEAFASDAGLQSAMRRDRAQLVETLSMRWVYGAARQAAATSLSPYLSGAPPARSLVQLGISRSRAGSTLRLSSASASAAASAPRTPPSLVRSGSVGSGHGNGHAPGDALAYGTSGNGLSRGTTTGTARTSLDSSLSPSAYLARRLRQQTPSLADLQAAATTSPGPNGASFAAPGDGSPGRQKSSVVPSLQLVGADARVGEDPERSTRRTGRESVESLLERVGRRSARRGV